jgi:hypothetical protein
MTRVGVAALVAAMRADLSHGRWGLPGHFVGDAGQALLAHGDAAVQALRPLLDDTTVLSVEGSEAATLQAQASWRIADLAAWLIARQRSLPAGARLASPDQAARDDAIAEIRRLAGS